jgi:hypothetical protein
MAENFAGFQFCSQLTYIDGIDGDERVYVFLSKTAMEEWSFETGGIKSHIAGINETILAHKRKPHYLVWLQRVYSFALNFGNHAVPEDIKRAVHSVEAGIGFPHYNFDA